MRAVVCVIGEVKSIWKSTDWDRLFIIVINIVTINNNKYYLIIIIVLKLKPVQAKQKR